MVTSYLSTFGRGTPRPLESLFFRHFRNRVLNRPFDLFGTVIVFLPRLDPLPRFILGPMFTSQSQVTRKLYYVVERSLIQYIANRVCSSVSGPMGCRRVAAIRTPMVKLWASSSRNVSP